MKIVVTVYGVPSTDFIMPAELDRFSEEIKDAVRHIKNPIEAEDKVLHREVSVLFPQDSRKKCKEDVIIFVKIFSEGPGKNEKKLRGYLALITRTVGKIVADRFPEVSVNCFVGPPETKSVCWEKTVGIDAIDFEEN